MKVSILSCATPSQSGYWNDKGLTLAQDGSFDEALVYFQKAIELDRSNATAWYNKGLCCKNLKRYKEAADCFGRALKLAPEDELTQRKRTEVLAALAPHRRRVKYSTWSTVSITLILAIGIAPGSQIMPHLLTLIKRGGL